MALKKPTWQSSTFRDHSSDRAVDGKFDNRSMNGNQCAISSAEDEGATWYVDLGSIQSIHAITIIPRMDEYSWSKSTELYLIMHHNLKLNVSDIGPSIVFLRYNEVALLFYLTSEKSHINGIDLHLYLFRKFHLC